MTDEPAAPIVAEEAAPALTVGEAAAAVADAPHEEAEVAEDPAPEPVEAEPAQEPEAIVSVVVTEAGSGLIFKGQLVGGVEQTFSAGEQFEAAESTAAIHEARGLVARA